jgi:hypothetical protein
MTTYAPAPAPQRNEARPALSELARQRSIQLLAAGWVLALAAVAVLGVDGMPDVIVADSTAGTVGFQLVLAVTFILFIAVIYGLTRKRPPVDFAARVGDASRSRAEVIMLGVYVAIGLVVSAALGFGFHPEGAVYGPIDEPTRTDFLVWAGFNLTVFGLVPYLWIRSRGYSNRDLGLWSGDRRADVRLILIVLGIEAIQELTVFTGIFDLSPRQVLVGMPLSFLIHLAGTGIPIMICIYAILLPRYHQLTGSITTSTILGGLTYAAFHVTEYWATFDTVELTVVSILLVFTQFTGPGMIKSILTLRTGNAWVHLWAYHAIVPHVTVDTPTIVETFEIDR